MTDKNTSGVCGHPRRAHDFQRVISPRTAVRRSPFKPGQRLPENVPLLHSKLALQSQGVCGTCWSNREGLNRGTGLQGGSPAQGPKYRPHKCIHSLAEPGGMAKCMNEPMGPDKKLPSPNPENGRVHQWLPNHS